MGKQPGPSPEELEFIFQGFLNNLPDSEILNEMQDEPYPKRNLRFIRERRKEFNAAKRVLQAQLERSIDPILNERKMQHLEDLAEVAKTLLAEGLGGLKLTGQDGYEYDRADDDQYVGEIVPFTMNLDEVRKSLHQNVEKAYDKHRNCDLFDYFLIHLASSMPGFPNPDKAELHKLADASPLDLIDALKMLALKKEFKGKCPVCEGWR